MGEPTVRELEAFGQRVRDRRQLLGLSVRALAARAGVSPAYITSIERGRNPSTGRPPVPSIQVVANLAAELGLDVSEVVREMRASEPGLSGDHVLLYDFGPTPRVFDLLDGALGADVDHWIYIADPRDRDVLDAGERATVLRWDLGEFPYETRHLDPDDIVLALERAVRTVAAAQTGRRVGLAIADCTAVMRWVQNAATEIALEQTWHGHVHRIWAEHLASAPAIDVCVYRHDDLRALGLTIDQIATALALIRDHRRVLAIDDGSVVSGSPAIRRILQRVQPPGVSPGAWTDLTSAAAETLAARRAPAPA